MKNRKVIINGFDYSYFNTQYSVNKINIIICVTRKHVSIYRILFRFKKLSDLCFFVLKRFLKIICK